MWKNSQSGRTMIETIAVLGIIGLVTSGLITMTTSVYNKYRIASITSQIKDLQKNIRTRYSALGNYSNLGDAATLPKLISDKVIPSNMLLNGTVVHAFGGSVVFNENTALLKDSVSGGVTRYSINFKDVRKEACVELLSLSWAINESSDLYSITTRNKTYSWDSTTLPLPMDVATVYNICAITTNQDITWIFQ